MLVAANIDTRAVATDAPIRSNFPDILYHYTCGHCAPRILESGVLLPGYQLVNPVLKPPPSGQFVWLTDLKPPPLRTALGLTSTMLKCDRMEHVFMVKNQAPVEWWMSARRRHLELIELELAPGVLPMHWFVSPEPLEIL